MTKTNEQGNNHKVAGTQEMITVQDSANQNKDFFNGISQEQLNEVCEVLSNAYSSTGLAFNPGYFQNYLEMTNKFIQGARMGEDKRNMVLNAFHFLCDALLASHRGKQYEPWEHVANDYYPEDLKDITIGEDEDFDSKEDLAESVCYEIESILVDWDPSVSNYDPEDWEAAKEVIEEYIEVLEDNDCEVPEWVYQDTAERTEEYTV